MEPVRRNVIVSLVATAALATVASPASARVPAPAESRPAGGHYRPGVAGVGDPSWPRDGNGGFDVRHYDLQLAYRPPGLHLAGRATITARATQDLSSIPPAPASGGVGRFARW